MGGLERKWCDFPFIVSIRATEAATVDAYASILAVSHWFDNNNLRGDNNEKQKTTTSALFFHLFLFLCLETLGRNILSHVSWQRPSRTRGIPTFPNKSDHETTQEYMHNSEVWECNNETHVRFCHVFVPYRTTTTTTSSSIGNIGTKCKALVVIVLVILSTL